MADIPHNPDLLPRIDVLGEAYEIPVLGKHRRIAVILPYNYHEHPERSYPVLYLQDGQNLYEDSAPFGTWAVNKRMAQLAEQGLGDIIIVAIDHAESYRIKEYLPFEHPQFGQGEGDQYVDFITQELKPQIDKTYRTKPDRGHTGIGGSSMGGLISLHAGLTCPEVYSKLMIFSPSLWIAKGIYEEAKAYQPQKSTRVFLYAGAQESQGMLPQMMHLRESLSKYEQQHPDRLAAEMSVHPEGNHSEHFWGEAFPYALRWLFFPESA